ncbi:MAG: hypothetical protein AB1592_13260 [Pseudomonadota bacterium]
MSPLPAPPAIWMQTLRGRAMDLDAPTPDMVDLFGEVAEALARVARYGGHTPSGVYSVAQHCVLGADAIIVETGDPTLAAAFLLHDAHEAYIGDITTPVSQALRARTGRLLADRLPVDRKLAARLAQHGESAAAEALASLKRDLDAAIHTAAGMPWPLPPSLVQAVREWDIRMLNAERPQILAPSPHPWDGEIERVPPARLRQRIRLWPWPEAADAYRVRLTTLFPHLCPPRAA